MGGGGGRERKKERKNKEKEQVMVWGKSLDSSKNLHEKRLYKKVMQILNDPTRTTLVADAATGVEDLYSREQIRKVVMPRFYPRLCQF